MTDQDTLGYELEPLSGVADSLCVMIHGYGADGSDMIGVASVMAPLLPGTHFVAPNGPEPCPTAPGFYQWYSMLEGRAGADLGAARVAPRINLYADIQLQRLGLADDRLIMLGFSQGGGVAMEAALRRQRTFAALLIYTGTLLNRHKLADEITARPPILLIHGELDEIIPVQRVESAARTLEAQGIEVQTYICNGIGHTLNEEGAYAGAQFASDKLYGGGWR